MSDPVAPTPARTGNGRLRVLIVLALAVVVGGAGVVWLRSAKAWESTDNAYLKTDSTNVAPKVRGLVAEVLVAENQTVVAGQPLVRLDAQEYEARVAAARADLAAADASVVAAEAALTRLGAEEALAASSSREAATMIAAADAQADRARSDWRRYEQLVGTGMVPRRDAERVRAESVGATAEAARARATLTVRRDQAAVTGSRRAELLAAIGQARAARAKAAAALDLTLQDQAASVIRAPAAGIVTDRQAQIGDYVQPGTRLLTLVPGRAVYITANFKETQTARMLPGQRAEVRVDALPGVVLKARIDSVAPGSGSEFALLPFEPGSGNFTKIVQRIPVRLVFDAGQPDVKRLRPGLSAKIRVRLRG